MPTCAIKSSGYQTDLTPHWLHVMIGFNMIKPLCRQRLHVVVDSISWAFPLMCIELLDKDLRIIVFSKCATCATLDCFKYTLDAFHWHGHLVISCHSFTSSCDIYMVSVWKHNNLAHWNWFNCLHLKYDDLLLVGYEQQITIRWELSNCVDLLNFPLYILKCT